MGFWEKIKRDIKKGVEGIDWDRLKKEVEEKVRKGMKAVKKGSIVVRERTEELTERGKKQYKILILKHKVHGLMAELGGKVYGLSSTSKNPLMDTSVKQIIKRIKDLEANITQLERELKKTQKKKIKKDNLKIKETQ